MKNLKLFLIEVGIVCFSLLHAQIEVKSIGNTRYGKWNEKWYTNDDGKKVPAGIYIYKLTAISHETKKVFSKSMKMVLLK